MNEETLLAQAKELFPFARRENYFVLVETGLYHVDLRLLSPTQVNCRVHTHGISAAANGSCVRDALAGAALVYANNAEVQIATMQATVAALEEKCK